MNAISKRAAGRRLSAKRHQLAPAGAMSAGPEPARYFELMSKLPKGCKVYWVEDFRHAPHVNPGEWVVVDLNRRDIEFDELFLIQQSNAPMLWQVCDTKATIWDPARQKGRREPTAMLRPMRKLKFDAQNPNTWQMSDGPWPVSALKERIIGRVIGIYEGGSLTTEHIVHNDAVNRPRDIRARAPFDAAGWVEKAIARGVNPWIMYEPEANRLRLGFVPDALGDRTYDDPIYAPQGTDESRQIGLVLIALGRIVGGHSHDAKRAIAAAAAAADEGRAA